MFDQYLYGKNKSNKRFPCTFHVLEVILKLEKIYARVLRGDSYKAILDEIDARFYELTEEHINRPYKW